MVSRVLPYEVNDILHRLAFLEQIPDNYKVDISRKTQYHKDSWSGWYQRWSKNVCRSDTISHIERDVNDAIAILERYSQGEYIKLVINSLNRAKIGGIKKLKDTTYSDDADVVTRLKTLIDGIQIHLDKYAHYLEPINSTEINTSSYITVETNLADSSSSC